MPSWHPYPGITRQAEDVRYTDVYERIKEARRADDTLNQGDWQREVKRSDWGTVIDVASEALSARTKDIQIAVWLTEGLIRKQGFAGLNAGLIILDSFIRDFWDHVYPLAEDGDLEYRSGPLEFLNDKVSHSIREIPLTDEKASEGFSWNRWQESRQVGYEKDTKNQWGDTDENKMRVRQEHIAEGRIPAETFDTAAGQSSKDFYLKLADDIDACIGSLRQARCRGGREVRPRCTQAVRPAEGL
ncbi:MAG: type VI secretion system protein TssA [Desulfobacterales bacterium]|nr:type VI secretion system protein TssA [Desulfobacterales bacterium]